MHMPLLDLLQSPISQLVIFLKYNFWAEWPTMTTNRLVVIFGTAQYNNWENWGLFPPQTKLREGKVSTEAGGTHPTGTL